MGSRLFNERKRVIGIFEQEGLDISPTAIEYIPRYLGRTAQRASRFPIPDKSFTALRNQYDAELMINQLAGTLPVGFSLNLCVVNVDLYVPRTNFIFGFADQLKKTALVSIYRLTGDLLIVRLGKEIIHELGHLMGLRHCTDRTCVMSLSHTIADTDAKQPCLCNQCRRKIEAI
jgi:archaemetzincin